MALIDEDIRIALIGKTGTGKSSCGNTIFGEQVFMTGIDPISVTENVLVETRIRRKTNITIADTPGIFGPESSAYFIVREMVRVCSVLDPGPHAFIIVISCGRFLEEDMEAIQKLKNIYGNYLLPYGIIVVTRIDELRRHDKTLESWIDGNVNLKDLREEFGNRIIGFDNESRDPDQVNKLVALVKSMKKTNIKEPIGVIPRCVELEMIYREEEIHLKEENEKEWEVLQGSLLGIPDKERHTLRDSLYRILHIRMGLRSTLNNWKKTRSEIIKRLATLEECYKNGTISKVAVGLLVTVGGVGSIGVGIGCGVVTGGASVGIAVAGAGLAASGMGVLKAAYDAHSYDSQAEDAASNHLLHCLRIDDSLNSRILDEELKTIETRLKSCLNPVKQLPLNLLQNRDLSAFVQLVKQVTFNPRATLSNTTVRFTAGEDITREMTTTFSDVKLDPRDRTPVTVDAAEYLKPIINARTADVYISRIENALPIISEDLREKEPHIIAINERRQ